MKQKLIMISLAGFAMISGSYAMDYPVVPENNGIAKKSIEYIFTDEGLKEKTSLEARKEAAESVNKLSKLIVDSIKATKIAEDGFITISDVKKLNTYMYDNYHNLVVKYHGDDEKEKINGKKVKIETGLHKVVNNGGVTKWKVPTKKGYKKANNLMDGIFHLGLYPTTNKKRILNEDGNKNITWRLLSKGLYVMLKDELNLKGPSKRAYYRQEIKKLRKERADKIEQLRQAHASKKEINKVRNEYNQKIAQAKREKKSD